MLPRQRLSGLNGAIPKKFDPLWQSYTDLSNDQIAAFQGFPEDLIKYARLKRWQKEISPITLEDGTVIDMSDAGQRKIATIKQAYDSSALSDAITFVAMDGIHKFSRDDMDRIYKSCIARVQATYEVLASVIAGKLTNRSQIDNAYSKIT